MKSKIFAFVKLLRPTYWLMTGGMSALTMTVLTKGLPPLDKLLLATISMGLITSGGFAFNDFCDRKPDSVIKPYRPIPAGHVTPKQALLLSLTFYFIGIALSFALKNWICIGIIFMDVALVSVYSLFIKRKNAFAGNLLIAFLIVTTFLYGEAALFARFSLASFSLSVLSIGMIAAGILRDILSLEGDLKVGYPTLPAKVGINPSAKVGGIFFLLEAILSPIPYLIDVVGLGYLLILIWDALLAWSFISLIRKQTVDNVRKNERMITMAMVIMPIALIAGAFT